MLKKLFGKIKKDTQVEEIDVIEEVKEMLLEEEDETPTTVVLSANLMMELEGWEVVQSYVYRAYRSGLSTQP